MKRYLTITAVALLTVCVALSLMFQAANIASAHYDSDGIGIVPAGHRASTVTGTAAASAISGGSLLSVMFHRIEAVSQNLQDLSNTWEHFPAAITHTPRLAQFLKPNLTRADVAKINAIPVNAARGLQSSANRVAAPSKLMTRTPLDRLMTRVTALLDWMRIQELE